MPLPQVRRRQKGNESEDLPEGAKNARSNPSSQTTKTRGQAFQKDDNMSLSTFLLAAGMISSAAIGTLQDPDAIENASDTLQSASVTAEKGLVVSRTDTLANHNSTSINDLMLQSSGLFLNDYGGAAGTKSISLRGLGSSHTVIYLDGVRMGNIQTGQNDLGMLPVENISSAVIDYAQNSVGFTTARPVFNEYPVAGKFTMLGGSFGTYLPSARLDFRINDRISLSANAAGVISKGNYNYGEGLTRANNDLARARGGLDLFGTTRGGHYHAKAWYSQARRGTPGSLDYPSTDRQKDINTFIQASVHQHFGNLYTLNASAKYSYDDMTYLSEWGDSRYRQNEVQLNSAHSFVIRKWLTLSLAADLWWDSLKSESYDKAERSRISTLWTAGAAFRLDRFKADIALEYAGAFDLGGKKNNALSPSIDMRFTAIEGLDIVAFARRAYRVPTYNELYYAGYGNPDLKCEDAWLSDLGLDFHHTMAEGLNLHAKADAFFNHLTNKIISMPSPDDPWLWLPYNVGTVWASGCDLSTGLGYSSGDWKARGDIKYSFLHAIDRTPDSYSYNSQLPYMAKHSVVLSGNAEYKGWGLDLSWNLREGRKDAAGDMPGWNSLDASLYKTINSIPHCGPLTLKIAGRNLTNQRYEYSTGYPMPGWSLLGGVEFTF